MKTFTSLLFWTVAAIFVVPAIVGVFAGIAVLGMVMLLGFVLAIAAIAVMMLCCVPVVWWCAVFDSTKVYGYLSKLQTTTKRQVPEGN